MSRLLSHVLGVVEALFLSWGEEELEHVAHPLQSLHQTPPAGHWHIKTVFCAMSFPTVLSYYSPRCHTKYPERKSAWIAHLIGGNGMCPHASAQAKADTTTQRKELQQESAPESKKCARMESTSAAPGKAGPPPKKQYTFRTEERDAFQHRALHAIVSSGAPFILFKDPEMRILFGMLHTTAPEVLPSGNILGGRLLNGAAEEVEIRLKKRLKGRNLGACTDVWKAKNRHAILKYITALKSSKASTEVVPNSHT
ncbi:hypothetical protein B0H10DRAFT_1944724 [Mycena sp. CBHHK59/15]|nr:hypothetical protein B0H10DRAFT_1944724 [Mycena sp. CBHHK59/15]